MLDDDQKELFGICVFLLIGLIGLPVGLYMLVADIQGGWVCYSKHGHILELPSACKFNLFSGLGLCIIALAIGIYKAWQRFR